MNPEIVKSSNVVEFGRVGREKPRIYEPEIISSRFYEICIESEDILSNTQQHFSIPCRIVAPGVTDFVFSEHAISFQKSMMISDCVDGGTILKKVQQAIVFASQNETINASINAGKLEIGDLYVKINMMHLRMINYDL